MMTMQVALYPRNDLIRLYLSRKEGTRGLSSIENFVDANNPKSRRIYQMW